MVAGSDYQVFGALAGPGRLRAGHLISHVCPNEIGDYDRSKGLCVIADASVFSTIPLQGERAGMGGRAKSYLSKLCARKGSDGGWCAEVSAFQGCRL